MTGLAVLHAMPNLTRPFGGPVEALIGFIAASQADVTATVLGPRCPDTERDWLAQQLPSSARIVFGSPWGPELRDLARRADVVHVHGLLNPFSSSAATIALAARRPVVIEPFGTLSRYTFTHRRRWLKQLYFQWLDGPNVRRAHAMCFTTAAERDEAAWHGIDFTGRAHIVPPPWRASPPSPRAHTGSTVLFLSRLHPKKGLDVLLAAWPLVRRSRDAARLIVAGSGAHAFRPTPGVEFVGFVTGDAKAARFAEADVFVLPSYHENFGVAVLEAVAAGVPAVVSTGVQLAPWIAEHQFGAVVERDPEAVAAAILSVLDDTTLRTRVAQHGAEAVSADFGLARVAPALRTMYTSAIDRCSS